MFHGGGYSVPPAAPGRILAWPDGSSLCVIYAGAGVVVRADEPRQTYEIDVHPITSVLVLPDRDAVVFSDFTTLVAYRCDDVLWRSRRLALDDVHIQGASRDTLHVSGSFGGRNIERFDVDLHTGEPSEHRRAQSRTRRSRNPIDNTPP